MNTMWARVFFIESNNEEVLRKGRLLQILLTAVTLIFILRGLAPFVFPEFPTLLSPLLQTTLAVFWGGTAFFIIRVGRPVLAAHIAFITFNVTLFFSLFVNTQTGAHTEAFAYLMIISVVAIAVIDSAQISMWYAAVITAVVSLYTLTAGGSIIEVASYAVTMLGVGIVIWLVANDLNRVLQRSGQLAQNLESSGLLTQQRVSQLQLIAEISQQTSTQLNLDKLLYDSVFLIRDQFNFYYVSIFLVENEQLVLREATGQVAGQLKPKNFHLPINSQSIVGWVALNHKPRISEDVTQDPLYLAHSSLPNTRSELAFPLMVRGRLLGVLDMESNQRVHLREEDISVFQILANQIGVNIDNAGLFRQTQTRLRETEVLFNLNNLLTSTMDVGEIYRRAARFFVDEISLAKCVISTWDAETDTLQMQIGFMRNPQDEYVTGGDAKIPLVERVGTSQLLKTLEPIIRSVNNPILDKPSKEALQAEGYYFGLELPLVRGGEAVGIVELYRNSPERPFTPGEVQLVQAMANQIAIALQNAILTSDARGQVAQLSTLNRLSAVLATAPTLKEVYQGASREIFSLVDATGMSILLLSPDKENLLWIYGYEYGQEIDLSQIGPLPANKGFSGYVVQTREALFINKDITDISAKMGSIQIGAAPSTWLGLPLIVANNLIGVLSVENELDSDAFRERDLELLRTIAGPLAITINNLLQLENLKTAFEAQSEQRLQLQTAAEVAAATTSILDVDELIQKSVNLIKERFDLYYVGLFLTDPETNYSILRAGTGEAGRVQLERKHRLPIGGQSLIGGASRDGKARIIQDVTANKEWRPNPVLPDTRSELAIPLRVRDRVIGALTVQNVKPNAYSPELISTLQTMCDQLAVAIENAQLLTYAEARALRQRELNEISSRLYRATDVNEIVRIGLQALSKHMANAPVSIRLGGQNRSTTDERPL